MIRITLPYHLRRLAGIDGEVRLDVAAPVTIARVLGVLEEKYPMLKGTIRDHGSLERRPFIRFFAAQQDLSHDPVDTPLPEAIASGAHPLMIVGAMAGG